MTHPCRAGACADNSERETSSVEMRDHELRGTWVPAHCALCKSWTGISALPCGARPGWKTPTCTPTLWNQEYIPQTFSQWFLHEIDLLPTHPTGLEEGGRIGKLAGL